MWARTLFERPDFPYLIAPQLGARICTTVSPAEVTLSGNHSSIIGRPRAYFSAVCAGATWPRSCAATGCVDRCQEMLDAKTPVFRLVGTRVDRECASDMCPGATYTSALGWLQVHAALSFLYPFVSSLCVTVSCHVTTLTLPHPTGTPQPASASIGDID